MGYQNVPMIIQLISTAAHIIWCWVLTDMLGLGIRGPAIANLVTNFINLVSVHVYTLKFTD